MRKIPDKKRISSIERKLDKWLSTPLTKDNVFQAIYSVLDMSAPHIKKTWPDGYCGLPGEWREKDLKSEIGNLIVVIEDVEIRTRLWSKYNNLVSEMLTFKDTSKIIFHSGCLDLLVEMSEEKIKKLKPENDIIELFTYSSELKGIIYSYLEHNEKIPLLRNKKRTQKLIEGLIKTFLNLVKKYKNYKGPYPNPCNHSCDEFLVRFYLFHNLKIPNELHELAQKMLEAVKKEIEYENDFFDRSIKSFEKRIKSLKMHISKIKESLS